MPVFRIKLACLEQFLDVYEISHLDCNRDDSKDDRQSDYDIGLCGLEDDDDAVVEDFDDDTDPMYDVADTGDHGQPENSDVEHSETGESTEEETNLFQGEDFTWSRTPPNFARGRRENIIVRLLLSMIRFDDRARRTKRRLEDKMAAFRDFWDNFIGLCKSLYLVSSTVCIYVHLLPFRGRCGFWQYMPKNEASTE